MPITRSRKVLFVRCPASPDDIAQLRAAHKPTPVKTGRIPFWLSGKIRAATRAGKFGERARDFVRWPVMVLQNEIMRTVGGDERWLDHWGTTDQGIYFPKAFVAEPYGFEQADVERFAELLGLLWGVFPNSWHYPGLTVRLLFYPDSPEQADRLRAPENRIHRPAEPALAN